MTYYLPPSDLFDTSKTLCKKYLSIIMWWAMAHGSRILCMTSAIIMHIETESFFSQVFFICLYLFLWFLWLNTRCQNTSSVNLLVDKKVIWDRNLWKILPHCVLCIIKLFCCVGRLKNFTFQKMRNYHTFFSLFSKLCHTVIHWNRSFGC